MAVIPSLEARTTPANAPGNYSDTQIVAVTNEGGARSANGTKAGPSRNRQSALVEKLEKDGAFAGKAGQLQFVRFGGAGSVNVLLLGFGASADLTAEKARVAGGNAYNRLKAEKIRTATVDVDSFDGADLRVLRAFAEGLVLGAYSYDRHRAKADKSGKGSSDAYEGVTKISFLTSDRNLKTQLDGELAQAQATAMAANITRDWSNEPSNFGTPEYYASEARRLGREHGLKVTILGERECAREKMGLFLGVGQGAEREGCVVIVEYNPAGAGGAGGGSKKGKGAKGGAGGPKTVALVGKGVTFDSGGISIKPSARMEEMKHDMTGAATVMGAMVLAAKWKVPNRVIGIMGFTENMPSGNAIQPGNVLTSRNGKTVEIINTDAEGRLVLADILDYVQDMNPDVIVDIATLTGAVAIALGKQCCAILGNDDGIIESVRQAGDANGERIWQLPLYDEYMDDLKSEWADMKNSANDSYGGTIRGAIFLKQFIRKGVRWAHLDIAATSANVSHLSYFPKRGATGAYVRTLAQFAADFR